MGRLRGDIRSPHPYKGIMPEAEQRKAARRIRNTNILRPWVDDDIRLMTPRKLARDWGFRVSKSLAIMVVLGRRLNREYVWKVHASSPHGQKWLLNNLGVVLEATSMFLRNEEIIAQINADWTTRGNQVIMYFPFIPDPRTEGFAEVADGKTNTALTATPDERPIIQIPNPK